MSTYTPWENVTVPESILKEINEGTYDDYAEKEKIRKKYNEEMFWYLLIIYLGLFFIISFILAQKPRIFETYIYPILIVLLVISFFISIKKYKHKPYKNEQERIQTQIQAYQKEVYEKKQKEIERIKQENKIIEENKRKEKNKSVVERFNNIVHMTSNLIFIAPFLSYSNWLKTDEWKSRGKLKVIYERLGYKVDFYHYKTLVITKETSNYKLLLKFNNSYAKPSTTAINTFLRERNALLPNESIFLSVEECSDNAKKLAKENGIKLILLKEFIRHLYVEFGLLEMYDFMVEYFITGKKSDLIECFLSLLHRLRYEYNSISEKLDEDYRDRCIRTISKIEELISELDSKIVDEEPLGGG